jgi:flagellar L-ring protein precursor FlgH
MTRPNPKKSRTPIPRPRPGTRNLAALAGLLALVGCTAPPLVQGPVSVRPVAPPPAIERAATGAIFRADLANVSLFSDQRKPQAIGDTLKIDISETLTATSKVTSTTSRENAVASKGPGTNSDALGSLLKGLANMNASASGSESFDGKGDAQNTSKFTGRIGAYVINVLSNGHLVVAGERSLAFNGGVTTLRFSGVVDPADIHAGGIVASADVVDAKLELVGKGDVSDAAGRSWLQRMLTNGLAVW